MKVIVIVVTYNGEKWIDKCFGSLNETSIPLQILAIDNGSSDNTVSLIKNKFPEVDIIETGSNLGFGKANNIGLKKALDENADYVFLLNQDAWVERDTIKYLVETAVKNPEYGIISPFHFLPGHQKLEWHFSTYISPEKCKDLYSDIYFNNTKEIYELDFVNAAAWLISKKCLSTVGGFDPLFPHYGEDDDYCNRLIYKNLKIGVAPGSIITHDINLKSWDEIKINFERQLIFCFIELKNIRLSGKYVWFNYTKTRIEKLISLFFVRKWKELFFMTKVFFVSLTYFSKINHSRKVANGAFSYLK